MKNKEPSIIIKDIDTKCDIEVGVLMYYKICCRKLVSKYYNIYRKVFSPQGIEINDLKQDILLMICQIVKENEETQKIPPLKLGGYLLNATKRQLNNIVSKALTTHRRMISLNTYHVDVIAPEESDKLKLKSDILLDILDRKKEETLSVIIKKICTEREALAILEYYFGDKNTVEIAEDMSISKQRVSMLIKQAIVKLKKYCEKQLEENKE